MAGGTGGSAGSVKLAFDGKGNAVAVWSQSDGARNNIYANRYVGATGTWQGVQLIETNDSGNALAPQIAADANGNAVVVWYQTGIAGGVTNIYANRYSGASSTWQGAQLIETNDSGSAIDPQIAFDLLKTGLLFYAAQPETPELPAISHSRNPQKPAGT